MILLPDHLQRIIYASDIEPNLEPDSTILFAHGFNIHFGYIKPPAGHDVIMVAPKAPGHRVREQYEAGAGVPSLVAVHPVSYTHLRAHETDSYLVCRLLLEK